jgi:hypothetical protein
MILSSLEDGSKVQLRPYSRQTFFQRGFLRPFNTNPSRGEKRDGSKRPFFARRGLLTRRLALLS